MFSSVKRSKATLVTRFRVYRFPDKSLHFTAREMADKEISPQSPNSYSIEYNSFSCIVPCVFLRTSMSSSSPSEILLERSPPFGDGSVFRPS